jgi:hypothetical protein
MGSRDDEYDGGLGSDSELQLANAPNRRSTEPEPFQLKQVVVRRRPASSNAALTTQGTSPSSPVFDATAHAGLSEAERPQSCNLSFSGSASTRSTTSPVVMMHSRHRPVNVTPRIAKEGSSTPSPVPPPSLAEEGSAVRAGAAPIHHPTPAAAAIAAAAEGDARGRLSSRERLRQRSSSWDAMRSRRHNDPGEPSASILSHASQAREQLKLAKRAELQLQLQQYQQQHKLEVEQQQLEQQQELLRRQLLQLHVQQQQQQQQQQHTVEQGALAGGMSLEEVFKLEKMLNAYKTQLLRERVMGGTPATADASSSSASAASTAASPVTASLSGGRGGVRTPPKILFAQQQPQQPQHVQIQQQMLLLMQQQQHQHAQGSRPTPPALSRSNSRDYLLQHHMAHEADSPDSEFLLRGGLRGDENRPPSRCSSGLGFFDDMDEAVLGAMDDVDSATYAASANAGDDAANLGSKAPNFKMFQSCDRNASGYVSPSSLSSGSLVGTPLGSTENGWAAAAAGKEESAPTMEELVAQLNDRVNNLARSPGNISFVSRQVAAKLALTAGGLQPVPAHLTVKAPAQAQCPSQQVLSAPVDNVRNQMLGLDSSKGVDCISSPRSAFSRAVAKPIPMPGTRAKPVQVQVLQQQQELYHQHCEAHQKAWGVHEDHLEDTQLELEHAHEHEDQAQAPPAHQQHVQQEQHDMQQLNGALPNSAPLAGATSGSRGRNVVS